MVFATICITSDLWLDRTLEGSYILFRKQIYGRTRNKAFSSLKNFVPQ